MSCGARRVDGPEVDRTTILWNVSYCLAVDTASHPGRHESSTPSLSEPPFKCPMFFVAVSEGQWTVVSLTSGSEQYMTSNLYSSFRRVRKIAESDSKLRHV